MANRLQITLIKSGIGYKEDQKRTLRALGFRRLNQSVIHNDTPSVRGMITKVQHMLQIEEVKDGSE